MVNIFVSHSSKYGDLAKVFKRSLQAIESTSLKIKISEEMEGSTDWRKWIEDNVRSSDVFLLLYPHAKMDMGWCNYELGRFYETERHRHIVCIKNTDIPEPPPAFQPYQAYDADVDGFSKFIKELFVTGAFSERAAVNPNVGKVGTDEYDRAQSVAKELAQRFAEARVQDHLYERRLVVSVQYDNVQKFDPVASSIEGNVEAMNLLGLDSVAATRWSTVRTSLGPDIEWPAELEKALPATAAGLLPPSLPPFATESGIYIPVIAKAESVDGVLRKVIVIFVATHEDKLRSLLSWTLPAAMPDTFKFLVRLVRRMLAARWDILEPRYAEARFRRPSSDRCAEIARSVAEDFAKMQREAEGEGAAGPENFYSVFDAKLRPEIDACGDEWLRLSEALHTAPPKSCEDLTSILGALLANNTKWLTLAAQQFSKQVADLSWRAQAPTKAS